MIVFAIFAETTTPTFVLRRSRRHVNCSFSPTAACAGATRLRATVRFPTGRAATAAFAGGFAGAFAAEAARAGAAFAGAFARVVVLAADLRNDPARSHDRDPVVVRAFARSHPDFGGLLGHGLVGKHVDPNRAATLEVVRDRSPGRLDLARRHPARFHRLEPVVALRDPVATMGRALHPAALEFAVLEALGLEH